MTLLQDRDLLKETGVLNSTDKLLTEVIVTHVEDLAEGVVGITLSARGGVSLPRWQPGAHVDLVLPSGLVRQYSLVGDPAAGAYEIAILRETSGRGGSEELHTVAEVGLPLSVRGPRNHFPLAEGDNSYLFIAGGIGITPLMPMLRKASQLGADWRLVYGGRSLASMAYLDELRGFDGSRVVIVAEDVDGRPDLGAVLAQIDEHTQIYACGPNGLLDALQERCIEQGMADRLHTERFGASAGAVATPVEGDQAFDIELAQSGITVHVEADQSIFEAVENLGTDLLFSCSEGYCGTCQVQVLSGTPEHRDTVASPEEHDEEGSMIICVGRSKSPHLVIDA